MQLIVAEKPSVARDLARVLGVRPVGQHCFESDRYVITWCVGHLVEIDEPAAHDPMWRPWRLDTLPILPPELRLRPSRHAEAQLRAVVRLLGERRFRSVVNACDAGREGELIFRQIYRHAGGGPPVQRLWISSLTDEAIRRGFASLSPGARFDPLADAARCRSEADWLVGMNATRALTVRARFAGHDALYSIGRVQTPTLAMLVAREQEIRTFVPRDYWEIRGDFRTTSGERFSATWRYAPHTRLATPELADTIAARDRTHGSALDPIGPRVEARRSRDVREPAPQLFDLTSLQRTANRRFGFSAARTLEIAQALYERHKVLTYPRTDSRHLASDQVAGLPDLFRTLSAIPDYAPFCAHLLATPLRPNRRIVDDTKVSDHHAIIPTGKSVRLESLDHDERRLFDLVVRRFLGVFYPDAIFAVTEVLVRVGAPGPRPAGKLPPNGEEIPILEVLPPMPDRYLARGRIRTEAGWQIVAGIGATTDEADPTRRSPRPRENTDDSDDPRDERTLLPPLVEGQALDGTFTPIAKQTRPPPRYTEATLLGAMESAGKQIDDETLRAAMRDCGLGTPATRASIIETLLDRHYIARDRQHLVPTPLGMQLVDTLPVASLASPELTGNWEARLARIARAEESRAAFMDDIARYIHELVDAIRNAPIPPPSSSAPRQPPRTPPSAPSSNPRPLRAPSSIAARPPSPTPASARASQRDERDGLRARSNAGGPEVDRFPVEETHAGFAIEDAHARFAIDDASFPIYDANARDRGDDPRFPVDSRPSAHRSTKRADGASSRASKRKSSGRAKPSLDSTRTSTRARRSELPHADSRNHPEFATSLASDASEPSTTKRKKPAARSKPIRKPASRAPRESRKSSSTGGGPPAQEARLSIGMASTRASSAAITTPRSVSKSVTPATAATPARPSRANDASVTPGRPASTANDASAFACPRCGAPSLVTGAKGWGCPRWREGCAFIVWFETAGRTLSLDDLRDLLVNGTTREARHVSNGSEVIGRLVLDARSMGGSAKLVASADHSSSITQQ